MRIGRKQLEALTLVAENDGKKFSYPYPLTSSKAKALHATFRRLQELGLIENYEVMAWLMTMDNLFAGKLLGKPTAFRARITPAGQKALAIPFPKEAPRD